MYSYCSVCDLLLLLPFFSVLFTVLFGNTVLVVVLVVVGGVVFCFSGNTFHPNTLIINVPMCLRACCAYKSTMVKRF